MMKSDLQLGFDALNMVFLDCWQPIEVLRPNSQYKGIACFNRTPFVLHLFFGTFYPWLTFKGLRVGTFKGKMSTGRI